MLIWDIETNGLLRELTKIHCLVIHDVTTERTWRCNDQGSGDLTIADGFRLLQEAARTGAMNATFNGINFDIPAGSKVNPWFSIPESSVIDLIVWARLIYPDLGDMDTRLVKKGKLPSAMFKRHSLEAWGHRLGEHKGEYTEWCKANGIEDPWAEWRPEMEDYCVQDVVVSTKLYLFLKPKVEELGECAAPGIEHGVAWVLARQERYGFGFNVRKAVELQGKLVQLRLEAERELKAIFPPFYVRDGKEFTPKRDNAKQGYTAGAPVTKVKLVEFNPGSRQHIGMMLKRRHGWVPEEFTNDGHPKVDETVLGALRYPEAKQLTHYLTINKRLGQLAEGDEAWLRHEVNGRIHGSVIGNGAVTGRMTHRKPNAAQVPAGRSPFGHECRELFEAGPGKVLVGADAEALELRDLAGYMARYDGGAYIRVVLDGKKEDGTDIHSVNARALGLDPKKAYPSGETGRDIAKVWFYAFIYGAGDEKLGSIILKVKGPQARAMGKRTRAAFMKNLPALGKLVEAVQKAVKARGYLRGLDGRRLHIRSSHAALNTLLQSAGAVQMKKALLILDAKLQAMGFAPGINYEFCANVHDEWQIECDADKGEVIGQTAVQSIVEAGEFFQFRCPLAGAFQVGPNWAATH